mgnify:CR=1 FL=1
MASSPQRLPNVGSPQAAAVARTTVPAAHPLPEMQGSRALPPRINATDSPSPRMSSGPVAQAVQRCLRASRVTPLRRSPDSAS